VLRQVFTNGEYPGFTLVRDITYYPDRSEYCLCALKETSEFKTDGTQFKEVLDELKPEFSLPSKAVVGLKRLNPRLYKQLVRNNPGIQQEFTEEVEYEPFDYIENYNLLDFNKYSKIDSEEVKKVNDAYDALMELADQLE
jgi:hypothetical protein